MEWKYDEGEYFEMKKLSVKNVVSKMENMWMYENGEWKAKIYIYIYILMDGSRAKSLITEKLVRRKIWRREMRVWNGEVQKTKGMKWQTFKSNSFPTDRWKFVR